MTLTKIIGAALLTGMFAVPAMADSFFIVRDKDAKDCRIVRERPTVTTTVVIGDHAYTSEEEARGKLKEVCVSR